MPEPNTILPVSVCSATAALIISSPARARVSQLLRATATLSSALQQDRIRLTVEPMPSLVATLDFRTPVAASTHSSARERGYRTLAATTTRSLATPPAEAT